MPFSVSVSCPSFLAARAAPPLKSSLLSLLKDARRFEDFHTVLVNFSVLTASRQRLCLLVDQIPSCAA